MATGGLFSTPRPEPGHLVPALGGAALIVVALPVFLLLGWPVSGWPVSGSAAASRLTTWTSRRRASSS